MLFNQRTSRRVGEAELAGLARKYDAWKLAEVRALLEVFRGLSGGTLLCPKQVFVARFACLYGLSVPVRERCFDVMDTKGEGVIEFEAFLAGLTTALRGHSEGRIRFLFSMYSSSGAELSFEELLALVRDSAFNCALQGQWNEAHDGKPVALPIVYLTEDERLQMARVNKCVARARALMDALDAPDRDSVLRHCPSVPERNASSSDGDLTTYTQDTRSRGQSDAAGEAVMRAIPMSPLIGGPRPTTPVALHTARRPNTASLADLTMWCNTDAIDAEGALRR
ncbi:MAG: hypothetical protein P4L40_15170, partial [Terracidiphilus sp.]|nr:hypothetical protein [Terracidiphilus sp.]